MAKKNKLSNAGEQDDFVDDQEPDSDLDDSLDASLDASLEEYTLDEDIDLPEVPMHLWGWATKSGTLAKRRKHNILIAKRAIR